MIDPRSLCALLVLGVGLTAVEHDRAMAQDRTGETADLDPWRFRLTTYGWLTSVSASTTARGQTTDVNASFIDIVQKSDSLLAYDGYFEANKGLAGLYVDFVWAKLGFPASRSAYRNPIAGLQLSATANAAITYAMTIVEVGGLYEIRRWPGDAGSFTAIDALAGFRYWNNSVDVSLDVTANVDLSRLGIERSRSIGIARTGTLQWVDPLIGVRLRHQFTPSQEAFVRADVGGFGLGSLYSWQAAAVYSYSWQLDVYSLAAVVGYRALSTKYASGTGVNAANIDVILHGPLLGFSVRF